MGSDPLPVIGKGQRISAPGELAFAHTVPARCPALSAQAVNVLEQLLERPWTLGFHGDEMWGLSSLTQPRQGQCKAQG